MNEIADINREPTADLVAIPMCEHCKWFATKDAVVRCEACRYWNGKDGCLHLRGLNLTSSDCFCSYGERVKGNAKIC